MQHDLSFLQRFVKLETRSLPSDLAPISLSSSSLFEKLFSNYVYTESDESSVRLLSVYSRRDQLGFQDGSVVVVKNPSIAFVTTYSSSAWLERLALLSMSLLVASDHFLCLLILQLVLHVRRSIEVGCRGHVQAWDLVDCRERRWSGAIFTLAWIVHGLCVDHCVD